MCVGDIAGFIFSENLNFGKIGIFRGYYELVHISFEKGNHLCLEIGKKVFFCRKLIYNENDLNVSPLYTYICIAFLSLYRIKPHNFRVGSNSQNCHLYYLVIFENCCLSLALHNRLVVSAYIAVFRFILLKHTDTDFHPNMMEFFMSLYSGGLEYWYNSGGFTWKLAGFIP